MESQQHPLIQTGSVQITRDGFTSPAVQLQLLRVWSVRIWFCQDVTVAIFVKGMLQWVTMRRQALGGEQRVAVMGEDEKYVIVMNLH